MAEDATTSPDQTLSASMSFSRTVGVAAASVGVTLIAGLTFTFVWIGVGLQNLCGDSSNSTTCGDPVPLASFLLPCSLTAIIGFACVVIALRAALGSRLAALLGWFRLLGLCGLLYSLPFIVIVLAGQIAYATPGTDDTWRSQGYTALGIATLIGVTAWTILLKHVVNRRVVRGR